MKLMKENISPRKASERNFYLSVRSQIVCRMKKVDVCLYSGKPRAGGSRKTNKFSVRCAVWKI